MGGIPTSRCSVACKVVMGLAIIGLVAIVAGLTLIGAPSLATGAALLLGCLAILGHSVLRVGRR